MRALGIVLAGGNSRKMGELSHKRAISAMPIAGSYRSIDFVLSNMSNSHIQKVAVITQYNSRSLHEHLSSSKWWDFGRKQGGLYTFTPTVTPDNSNWYQGTADSIYQNLLFLKRSHEPYVVIATGDCVYKMDFNKVLEYHIAKKADITVAKSKTVSCGIYVIRRRQLIELIEKSAEEGRHDLVQDILIRYKDVKRIYGYKIESYWRNIATVEDYYGTNMDDLPPAKYNPGAHVRNSLISSGCIINGTVENSVLFKEVFVGNNCTIKNSIILNDVYLGDNTHIENCIVESRNRCSRS